MDQWLREHDAILDDLKFHLLKAQHSMKVTADLRRRDLSFQVLKLQPYSQQFLARRHCDKLFARYYGPFEVLARICIVVYKLDLPPTSKIHSIFHVYQMNPVRGTTFIASGISP